MGKIWTFLPGLCIKHVIGPFVATHVDKKIRQDLGVVLLNDVVISLPL